MKADGKEITAVGIDITVCGNVYHISRQTEHSPFIVTRFNRSEIHTRRVFRTEKTLVEFFKQVGIKC